MNVLDGRRFVGLLAREGFSEAASPEEAGVILLNTCSVRDKAEQKVYDRLGRLAKLKRERPDTVLGVCGCVAQQEGETTPRAPARRSTSCSERDASRPCRRFCAASRKRATGPARRASTRTKSSTRRARSRASWRTAPRSRSSRAATRTARSASFPGRAGASAIAGSRDVVDESRRLLGEGAPGDRAPRTDRERVP